MLETIKIKIDLYEVKDETRSLFVMNPWHDQWHVFDADSKTFIAKELNSFGEAESTAFEFLMQEVHYPEMTGV